MESLSHWTNIAQKAVHNRVDHALRGVPSARNEEEDWISIGINKRGDCNISVNIDGAWKMDKKCKEKNYAGIGWRIFNNITNTTIHSMSMPIRSPSPTDAETRGILHLMKWLIDKNIKDVLINTDCKAIIAFIKGKQEAHVEMNNLIEDLCILGTKFNYCRINFTSRQDTLDAHKLAIQARITGLQQSF